MVKIFQTNTLLSLTGTTGASTPISYGRTDKSTIQVAVVNGSTGVTTVNVKGTVAATSTGAYVTLDTQSKTATENYHVALTSPYTYVKVDCTAIATTGSTVGATIVTQGDGY